MPRPRQFQNNAEKQAAYRQRHAAQSPPRQGYLAALARSLHGELRQAVQAQQSELPPELLGATAAETMGNLIRYIRSQGEQGEMACLGDEGGERCPRLPSAARSTRTLEESQQRKMNTKGEHEGRSER
jgi:hypothetical protein